MELKRVVVTGLGAVTPVGNSVDEMWSNLLAGKSGAAPITSFDTTNFKQTSKKSTHFYLLNRYSNYHLEKEERAF